MSSNFGNKVLVKYNHASTGQHIVNGPVTKEQYGYFARGAQFYAWEADINAKPWLFQPIEPKQVLGEAAPPPPHPELAQMPKEQISQPAQKAAEPKESLLAKQLEAQAKVLEAKARAAARAAGQPIVEVEPESEEGKKMLSRAEEIIAKFGPVAEEQVEPKVPAAPEGGGTSLRTIPWEMPISEKVLNILEAAGVTTVEQIRDSDEETLRTISGIGPRTASSLKEQVEALG